MNDNVKTDETIPEGIAQVVAADGTVETIPLEAPIVPDAAANDAKAEEFVRTQLANLVGHSGVQKPIWKMLLSGALRPHTPKASKFWHNGQLLSKEEYDKLSWAEVHASNNKIK